MSNNSSSQRMISNTAKQIGYINYSNSSDRFSGFFTYKQDFISRLFTLPALKRPNQITKAAIEETRELDKCTRFDTINDLFNDLEN
jgi:hypothetical protein